MNPRLIEAKYVNAYVVHVRFSDGVEGCVDMAGELQGEVFEPLKNISLFRQLRLDPELRTVVWPSGADVAPEFLYDRIAAVHA